MTKPHSDKSARAQRRAAARELARAPETAVPRQVAQPGQISVSIPDLLAKIGALTVERDILQNQLARAQQQAERLLDKLDEVLGQGQEESEGETPQELDGDVE